jgi:hypothetical protein
MAWLKLWINGQSLHCNDEKKAKGKRKKQKKELAAFSCLPTIIFLTSPLFYCSVHCRTTAASKVKILHLYVSWIYVFWQDIFL